MIKKTFLKTDFIASLTIHSDAVFIPQAQQFVRYYAGLLGFNEKELLKLELITEEALVNTIENSFGKEYYGTIDVRVSYKVGHFIITVEDKGLPVDFRKLENEKKSAIGILLMKNLADEFRFINRGKQGKMLEMVKYLPQESILEQLSEGHVQSEEKKEPIITESPRIRLISPDDAEMLARLAFKVYGYTYVSVFYYPEKIRELIQKKLLISAVCVNSEEDIVGSLSLFFEKPDARVADSGAAMVDPIYRGHNLFKKMKCFLRDYASQNDMYGIYSEAVTIHPFTQQGNISLGAKETGVMLAFIKEKVTFKKINDNILPAQRQAVVLYYLKVNKEPHRHVYLTEKFSPMLSNIYKNLDLDRTIHTIPTCETHPFSEELSVLHTSVKPDLNVAVITVQLIGHDAFELIMQQLKTFCLKKIETIYLEIPLNTPGSAVLSAMLNKEGFLLSGIIPEFDIGDYLKMQYLNNVLVEPDNIHLASELAKELLRDIIKDYKFL